MTHLDVAKKYIDENGEEFLYACAMIVNSRLVKFMVKGFIRMKNRKIPVEIFSSEADAVNWFNRKEERLKS